MIREILPKLGLNDKEIDVFIKLNEIGTQPASIIARQLHMPRNSARFILDQLFEKKLVTKSYKGNGQLYSPVAPSSIKNILEIKKKRMITEMDRKIEEIQKVVPELESIAKRDIVLPKIRFYEGIDGVQQVLNDSLQATEEIYTYADVDGMVTYIDEINQEYVAKREKMGLKKKGIVCDTPFTREYMQGYYPGITEVRYIPHKMYPFALEMEIYDNKISYMTFSDEGLMAVVIENKEIYEMNRSIFKHVWDNATPAEKLNSKKSV